MFNFDQRQSPFFNSVVGKEPRIDQKKHWLKPMPHESCISDRLFRSPVAKQTIKSKLSTLRIRKSRVINKRSILASEHLRSHVLKFSSSEHLLLTTDFCLLHVNALKL